VINAAERPGERHAFAELPPRVEHRLTPFGEKIPALLDGVEQLQREVEGG